MKVQLIAITLLLLVSACSSGSIADSGISAQSGKVILVNWPIGQTGKVLFVTGSTRDTEFYSTNISSDGALEYNLSAPTGLYTPTMTPGSGCSGSINVTPLDWKMVYMWTPPVYLGGNTEKLADGFVNLQPLSSELTNIQEGQSIFDGWLYVDKETSITGSIQCAASDNLNTFNIHYKAGWNFRLIKVLKMVNGQVTQVETYSSQTLPSFYKFKYIPRTTASLELR